MDDMRVIIAQALMDRDPRFKNGPPFEYAPASVQRDFLADALAVLRAMRRPTTAMILSCADLPGSQQEFWQRSIGAALGPSSDMVLSAVAYPAKGACERKPNEA